MNKLEMKANLFTMAICDKEEKMTNSAYSWGEIVYVWNNVIKKDEELVKLLSEEMAVSERDICFAWKEVAEEKQIKRALTMLDPRKTEVGMW